MSSLSRHRCLAILQECRGDEIWSPEHCAARGVPNDWVDELADTFESGFQHDRQTIYWKGQVTNQYRGVRDVDLAMRVASSMGLDVDQITATALGPSAVVKAIKESVMDD